ncbi:hypothetical protein ElyMa_003509300 [Elysia marginata]|uniref:Uncharacterized protein n=1 Tax=Elysia marginata TaxID=1093978 RepID=A0AAV4EGU2_9GAST|nr:hypothetical protein ElyMa_003509300 [Elysia marginata]
MRLRITFRGRRTQPENTGSSSGGSGNSNNNNNQPDPPRTLPTQPPTQHSTTTTTTTEATTPRPVATTAEPTLSPTRRPKPLGTGGGGGGGVHTGTDGEPVPGSDGFPSDETVIHAGGGGNRGGRDSNINSGVIEDSSATDSAISQHGSSWGCLNTSLSRLLAIAAGLVISNLFVHIRIR